MPKYTTTIKLMSGTDNDYEQLSQELVKKKFTVCRSDNFVKTDSEKEITFATNGANMLDVTALVSASAANTGRKFTYSVRKEKVLEGKY